MVAWGVAWGTANSSVAVGDQTPCNHQLLATKEAFIDHFSAVSAYFLKKSLNPERLSNCSIDIRAGIVFIISGGGEGRIQRGNEEAKHKRNKFADFQMGLVVDAWKN